MKTGRNDPCPCGSGKKYKKCCLSKSYADTGRDESIRKVYVDKLLEFLRDNYNDTVNKALDIYWGVFEPEKYLDEELLLYANGNFAEWLIHDYIVERDDNGKGRTLIDVYMNKNKGITINEHKVLTMMKNSVISLYEVQDVFADKGLLVKDLLMGGEYDVREKAATKELKKWDILATRLQYVDGKYILSGCIYPYNIHKKDELLGYIQTVYGVYISKIPEGSMDIFLKKTGQIFNELWYEPFKNPPNFQIRTTNWEDIVISKSIFEIINKKAVISGLKKIKELTAEGKNEYMWYGETKSLGDKAVFGRVEIKDKSLILECNSKERLEAGKKILSDHLSAYIIHTEDSFQELKEAMLKRKEVPDKSTDNDIPMEVQQEVYTQFMENHCKNWINDRIPALDYLTPKKAVESEEGREKVIELLKQFANIEERNKKAGKPHYDISWLWDELGIERDY